MKKEQLQSRRGFFKRGIATILPTLGLLILPTHIFATKTKTPTSCIFACMYGCYASCIATCYMSCHNTCFEFCANSCYINCADNCQGTCLSTCKGKCSAKCAFDCDVVLGGFMAKEISASAERLKNRLKELDIFRDDPSWLRIGQYPQKAGVYGAAWRWIEQFMIEI